MLHPLLNRETYYEISSLMITLRKLFFWLLYAIGALGTGLSLAGFLAALMGIGRPWLIILIGLGLLAAADIIAYKTLSKRPRCGSRLIDENGRCQICGYKPEKSKIRLTHPPPNIFLLSNSSFPMDDLHSGGLPALR